VKIRELFENDNKSQIDEFLASYWRGNWEVPPYELNSKGEIDIDLFIQVSPRITTRGMSKKITKLPLFIKFGTASKGFSIAQNELTTLVGCPHTVINDFYANENSLDSFEGAPKDITGFADFDCNKFTSLHNIHKHITRITGNIRLEDNILTSSVLGLLMIKELKRAKLDNAHLETIINKYLPNTRGNTAVMECQRELIDAGLEEYAKL